MHRRIGARMALIAAIALLTAALIGARPAGAEMLVGSYPYIVGTLDIEIEGDNTVRSDDPLAEIAEYYTTLTLTTEVGLFPHFSVGSEFVFEPVLDPVPGEDRHFQDHGLYVSQLFLQLNFDPVTVIGGKIHPDFGIAWDAAPGIYGTGFAGDYELAEMIGFAFYYTLTTDNAGSHILGVNAFMVDMTVLSDSSFTRRGRTMLSDGGPANTGRLDSFSITLDGGEIPTLPGFTYHIGFRHQTASPFDFADENGVALGFTQEFPLGSETTVVLVGEGVYLDNAYATPDNMFYATGGFIVAHGPWHLDVSGTVRNTYFAGGMMPTQHDFLFQVSGGREIFDGCDLSLGYAFTRDAGVRSHTVGFLLAKSLEFDTRANGRK